MRERQYRKATERARRAQLHRRMGWRTAWQLMEQFVLGRMAVEKACEWLGVGRSRLYELRRRFIETWEKGSPRAKWLYGRPDALPSRLSPSVQQFLERELRYWREQSAQFRGHINFAFLAQECRKRFGKRFHRNTLRRWAAQRGLFDPRTDRTGKAYVRFEMGGVGMLFQHDSSIHGWVPAMRVNSVLILTVDDHSRLVVGARLVEHDIAWNHLRMVRETVETHGVPLAYYTDNHAIFNSGTDLHTQFGRALQGLDITLKLTAKAYPQAKGKVEKRFDYFQRRIPLLCEKRQVKTLREANRVLAEEVAFYNEHHVHDETQEVPQKRWQRALEEGRAYLRPLDMPEDKRDLLFGLHYERVVRPTRIVEFAGLSWPVPNGPVGKSVTVVLRYGTSPRRPRAELFVVYQGRMIAHHLLPRMRPPTFD